jgi:predicted Zn-dependent peptidase
MPSQPLHQVPRAARSRVRAALLLVTAALLLAAGAALAAKAPAKGEAPAAPAKAAPAKGAPLAPAPVPTGLENLEKQVREFTLPNGLRFIVVERHQAPVFSFCTAVNAGGANDQVGTTGIAHMMEHMAFKGTPIVGTKDWNAEKPLLDAEEKAWDALLDERRKGAKADSTGLKALEKAFTAAQEAARAQVVSNEFSSVIERAGARDANAMTGDDMTRYFYSMPSNRLELWALMEGGRMAHPVFREFYKEREVVREERRMGIESSPSGRLFMEFVYASYVAHPYHFGVIGYDSDLRTFSRTEGDAYFRRNYVAKNMAVVVVGDVTVKRVQELAQKYFGDLSDAPAPPPVDTEEPVQKAERRVIIEDPAQPLVFIGWHIPAGTDPTYPAYKALASLIAGGDWARINKALVKEKKIITQIGAMAGFPGEKYPNQLVLFVVPAAGQDPEKVEQEIYAVLDGILKDKPFTDEELQGYKVRTRAQRISAVENNSSLANQLAEHQILRGDWREFFRGQERVQALTVADVMGAMKKALIRSNRTVAMIVNPKPAASNEGGR